MKGRKSKNPVLVLGEIGLLRSLGELNVPLILGTEDKQNPVWYSKYPDRRYILPQYDTQAFIDELCAIGATFDKRVVIYSDDDRAIMNISKHREQLEEYYLFLYPTENMVEKILDKQKFVEASEMYNLPAPESYLVNGSEDMEMIADSITYPCIIKPAQRHFWWGDEFVNRVGFYKKAIKCLNREYFLDIYRKIAKVNPNVVIQSYVKGADKQHYSANLFVDDEGEIGGYYIAQKKRIYPIKAGVGTCIVTVDNSEVFKICVDIVDKLKLKGLVNIQFKRDSRTGEYKLMEIHARNSMWCLLGNRAGVELAKLYYQVLTGNSLSQEMIRARTDVKYIDLIRDFKALLQYRAEGELGFWQWLRSLGGERAYALFSTTDPKPMLMQLWMMIKKGTGFAREPVPGTENTTVSETKLKEEVG